MSPVHASGAAQTSASASVTASVSSLRARFVRTLSLWPVENGRCTCGQVDAQGNACRRAGKHPKYDGCASEPEHGYAVITGATSAGGSGVFVLDVDVKGGTDGYAQLEAFLTDYATPTLTVRTPSGGVHLYFRHPGFHVGQHKPASALDIRGDGNPAYVVGPGSPGYVIVEDAPIADAPPSLLAWLRVGSSRTSSDAFTPTPIDPSHPQWDERVARAIEACTTMAPSKADGEGGRALFNVALHLVRTLELPVDVAHETIAEHFNPRCTDPQGNPYPWSDTEISHKLEDARDRSSRPCGPDPVELRDVIRAHARRFRPVIASKPADTPSAEHKVTADDCYGGERSKLSVADAVQMLYSWPDWAHVFHYDVLKRRPFAVRPPVAGRMTLEDGVMSKADIALIRHWFDVRGFLASADLVESALWTVVKQPDRQVNAIANYLDALPAVESDAALDVLTREILGCQDDFARVLVKKHLVAAVRRARNPGYGHKGMLVLQGAQGAGKTPFVRILAGDWYHTTGTSDLTQDMTKKACAGHLLVEVEELSSLRKDRDTLKALISASVDVLNVKYEPDNQIYPRSFVFIGTTNKRSFLSDPSGDSRYWIVKCGARIDLARLETMRDEIWAAADFLARTMPDRWNYLTPDEEARLTTAQGQFRREDAFLSDITTWLTETKHTVVDAQLVWESAIKKVRADSALAIPAPTPAERDRIEEVLETLGFEKCDRAHGTRPRFGKRRPSTWWERSAPLAAGDDEVGGPSGPQVVHGSVQPN
jgi:hypothetical protein